MLLPAEQSLVFKKQAGKRYVVQSRGTSGSKMVFILLTEVVTLHVTLTAVKIQGLGL